MIETKNTKMVDNIKDLPKAGDDIEGVVIANEKNSLYVDLGQFGTGLIFGKEYLIIKELIKNIKPGVKITARIVELEGEDGYMELSLKEAKEAEVWQEAEKAMKEKKTLTLFVKEANKGGLMVNWQGVVGFIPVSQLSGEHYPKVTGGDKNRILTELEKLVNERLDLVIITVDPQEGKLIFSEKAVKGKINTEDSEKNKNDSIDSVNMMERYSIGDVLEVEVIGVVDFGIFCKLPAGDEGLVHISEVSWSLITDLKKLYNVGDKITVKVIEINREKVSLSIKALTENPWKNIEGKYKEGQEVKAVVIKISNHGALVSVEEGVYGLVHVSEFNNLEELKEKIQLGDVYNFKIKVFDVGEEKMILKPTDK